MKRSRFFLLGSSIATLAITIACSQLQESPRRAHDGGPGAPVHARGALLI